MEKYRDIYAFRYERCSEGKIYNREDNFLSCRSKGKVFRISNDTLKFVGFKKIRIKKVDKKTGEVIDYTDLIIDVYDTDEEREITFKEENLEKLEGLFKIRKKIKRELTEDQREALRVRFAEVRKKMNNNSTEEISDEELLESLEEEIEDKNLVEDLDLELDNDENDTEEE